MKGRGDGGEGRKEKNTKWMKIFSLKKVCLLHNILAENCST